MVNEVPTDERTADAQKRQVNVCAPLGASAKGYASTAPLPFPLR